MVLQGITCQWLINQNISLSIPPFTPPPQSLEESEAKQKNAKEQLAREQRFLKRRLEQLTHHNVRRKPRQDSTGSSLASDDSEKGEIYYTYPLPTPASPTPLLACSAKGARKGSPRIARQIQFVFLSRSTSVLQKRLL